VAKPFLPPSSPRTPRTTKNEEVQMDVNPSQVFAFLGELGALGGSDCLWVGLF
jgi:hypothetical protein